MIAFATLFVLVVCFIGTIAVVVSNGSKGQPSANQSNTATSMPATSQTSEPPALTTSTLGGTEAAFQDAYGTPSGTGAAKTYSFMTQSGVVGLVTVTPLSGTDRIASLRVGPKSGTWDAAIATPICGNFIPADNTFIKTVQVSGYGPERVYQSADLAKVFSADQFTDNNTGNAVTPGTFSMELGSGFPFNTGCIIILGT